MFPHLHFVLPSFTKSVPEVDTVYQMELHFRTHKFFWKKQKKDLSFIRPCPT